MRGPDDALRAEALGRRIRKLRRARGWAQADVAAGAGIHRSHLSHIERGRRGVPVAVLLRICEALWADPAELVAGLHELREEPL